MKLNLFAISCVAAFGLASSACVIQTTPITSNGSFELDWTINGVANASLCTQAGATSINIVVTRDGTSNTYASPCANFATFVDLPTGSYTFSATLVDGGGVSRSPTVSNSFLVSANQRTFVPANFVVQQAPGQFEVDWTINGQNNTPSLCTQSAAATISVAVTQNGSAVGTYSAPCSAFATFTDLPPGNYTFGATLLDGNGVARTTTASNNFTVNSGLKTTVPVDFPPSAFF
ncbi:hypothetical protein BH09MYX1_BH09MYX1_19810 [soil metagenome]